MKIVKKTNGNIVILNTDATVKAVIQQTGLQMLLEGDDIKIIQNGYPIAYIKSSEVTHTQIEPAAQVAFSGDNSALMTLLAEDFFDLQNVASIQADITTLQSDITTLQNNTAPIVTKYIARLEQSGTDAPIATIIYNSLSGVPVWTRTGSGEYLLTLASEFTAGKTAIDVYTQDNALGALTSEKVYGAGSDNINSIYLLTGLRDAAGAITQVDDVMSGTTWIEITVYP